MKRRTSSLAVSVAACALALPSLAEGEGVIRLQIFPAGEFRPVGTPSAGEVPACGYWRIDAAAAAQMIARAQARATKICVDYEHQTLHAKHNGQPAPAAAWIDQATLEWVDGEGVFAEAALTQRARGAVATDEIKYFSPVFIFDQTTGTVLDFKLGALTNTPAIDGMQPLAAAAQTIFAADLAALSQQLSSTTTNEEPQMEELLERLQWLLNMPVGTTAAEFAAQLDKIKAQLLGDAAPEAQAAASFDLGAHLAALNQKLASNGAPDPALFVPVAVMKELQGQIAALSQAASAVSVEKIVDEAISASKLLPAQRDWALALGRKDLAALSQYVDQAPAIAALSGSQTSTVAPATPTATLNDTAMAVCSQLGLSPAEFAKGKL